MNRKSSIQLVLLFALLLLSSGLRAQKPDDTSLQLAQGYQQSHNYLLAYKSLIIYKFVNIQLLEKPINHPTLQRLDAVISTFEECLNQRINLSPLEIRRMKGWSDQQLDSTYRDRMQSIPMDNLRPK